MRSPSAGTPTTLIEPSASKAGCTVTVSSTATNARKDPPMPRYPRRLWPSRSDLARFAKPAPHGFVGMRLADLPDRPPATTIRARPRHPVQPVPNKVRQRFAANSFAGVHRLVDGECTADKEQQQGYQQRVKLISRPAPIGCSGLGEFCAPRADRTAAEVDCHSRRSSEWPRRTSSQTVKIAAANLKIGNPDVRGEGVKDGFGDSSFIGRSRHLTRGVPSRISPITTARSKPSARKIASTSSTLSGAQETSRPPEVWGSVSNAQARSGSPALKPTLSLYEAQLVPDAPVITPASANARHRSATA